MNPTHEQEISVAQAEAIARGLYAIASCDGLHEREAALIASFWADAGGGPTALAELARRPVIPGDELSRILGDGALVDLFLKSAMLLAWADGNVSAAESEIIKGYAKELNVAPARFEQAETQAKEFLLANLSHLNNTDVVIEVARKLQI